MDSDPDPLDERLAEFDAATPEGKLRLIFMAALDVVAWLEQIEHALTEGPPMTDEERLEAFIPEGPEN